MGTRQGDVWHRSTVGNWKIKKCGESGRLKTNFRKGEQL